MTLYLVGICRHVAQSAREHGRLSQAIRDLQQSVQIEADYDSSTLLMGRNLSYILSCQQVGFGGFYNMIASPVVWLSVVHSECHKQNKQKCKM